MHQHIPKMLPKRSPNAPKILQNPSKIDPRASPERPLRTVEKSIEKSMLKVMFWTIDFGPAFGPNYEKSRKKNIEIPAPKKTCFLMPKGSKIEPKHFPKSMKKRCKKQCQKNVCKLSKIS